jgi:hypothetical protein
MRTPSTASRSRAPQCLLLALLCALALPRAAAAEDELAPSPAAAEMLKSMREKGILTEEEYQELYRKQAVYEARQREEDRLPLWLRDWTVGGDLRFRYDRLDTGRDIDANSTLIIGEDAVLLGDQISSTQILGQALGESDEARFRMRIGAEKGLGDYLTAGVRIATTSDSSFAVRPSPSDGDFGPDADFSYTVNNPRSENVSFGELFSPKDIALDRAYVRVHPPFAPTFRFTVGKFGNPFLSHDFAEDFMVFDNDIQPEGVAAEYRFDFLPKELWLESVAGLFVVQEIGNVTVSGTSAAPGSTATPEFPDPDDEDPYLFGFQGGLHAAPRSDLRFGARGSYYQMRDIGTSFAITTQALGNGADAIEDNPTLCLGPSSGIPAGFRTHCGPDGNGLGDAKGKLEEVVADVYAEYTPFGEKWAIKPFFQWATILGAEEEDDAWSVGAELGSLDLLELTVMYARVERNGTIAAFTDSDLFDGFTNAKGWLVQLQRQLLPGLVVRAAWFRSKMAEDQCRAEASDPGAPAQTFLCGAAGTATDVIGTVPELYLFRKAQLSRDRWQLDFTVSF